MIDEIRKKIVQNKFEFTKHATDQSILRTSVWVKYGKLYKLEKL